MPTAVDTFEVELDKSTPSVHKVASYLKSFGHTVVVEPAVAGKNLEERRKNSIPWDLRYNEFEGLWTYVEVKHYSKIGDWHGLDDYPYSNVIVDDAVKFLVERYDRRYVNPTEFWYICNPKLTRAIEIPASTKRFWRLRVLETPRGRFEPKFVISKAKLSAAHGRVVNLAVGTFGAGGQGRML